MNKVTCIRCGYEGYPHKENGNDICPHCKSLNSFEEDDGVSEDDYRNQDDRDVPSE